jgi:hypothetical protein
MPVPANKSQKILSLKSGIMEVIVDSINGIKESFEPM